MDTGFRRYGEEEEGRWRSNEFSESTTPTVRSTKAASDPATAFPRPRPGRNFLPILPRPSDAFLRFAHAPFAAIALDVNKNYP